MALITLPDAKAHLNLAVTTYDTELQTFINSAEAAILARVGIVELTAGRTYRAEGRSAGLCLPTGQTVVSVQSVTPVGGAAIDLTLLHVNAASGVITYDLGGTFTAVAYDVSYTAGYAAVPEDLKMAVKELVRHLWTTQRGGSARPGAPVSDALSNTIPGAAHTFPIRVEQLLRPYLRTGVR